jgi:hypothetical protein
MNDSHSLRFTNGRFHRVSQLPAETDKCDVKASRGNSLRSAIAIDRLALLLSPAGTRPAEKRMLEDKDVRRHTNIYPIVKNSSFRFLLAMPVERSRFLSPVTRNW